MLSGEICNLEAGLIPENHRKKEQRKTDYGRHAEDSGVEVQRLGRVFNPQHGLLHHEVLQKSGPTNVDHRNIPITFKTFL